MEKVLAVVIISFFVICLSALFAVPTMLLVNYLLSEEALVAVFGAPLNFWKALVLNIVCGLLVSSGGGRD